MKGRVVRYQYYVDRSKIAIGSGDVCHHRSNCNIRGLTAFMRGGESTMMSSFNQTINNPVDLPAKQEPCKK
jgi:hypothetical protein